MSRGVPPKFYQCNRAQTEEDKRRRLRDGRIFRRRATARSLTEAGAPKVVVAGVNGAVVIAVAGERHASLAASITPKDIVGGIDDVVEVVVTGQQRLKCRQDHKGGIERTSRSIVDHERAEAVTGFQSLPARDVIELAGKADSRCENRIRVRSGGNKAVN